MLGIVFSEFLDMVEEAFSPRIADQIIETIKADLPSGGAYTTVGNYDHVELLALVTQLSATTDLPVNDLVRAYGKHLFGRFHHRHPAFFESIGNSFEFLSGVETRIHREVRKLYPEAELPKFDCTLNSPDTMVMIYSSARPFAGLAHGLIEGCAAHYGEKIDIAFTDISGGAMTNAKFVLTRKVTS